MNAITEQGSVNSKVQNGIGEVEFFHPMSNSLPGKILNAIADQITALGGNADVRVIILRSQGEKAFCAGASFDELIAISDFDAGQKFFSGFANVINSIRKCPKFVIGRVQGKAVGGGVGLASAVDYCVATREAAVKLSELAVGIGPFVVGPAVERKMGLSAMSELAINATEWRSAEWAHAKGLYTSVHDTVAEMDEEIKVLATRLALSNPEAMAMLKNIFWSGTENWDDLLLERAGMSGKLVLSDFTRNAINAFKKR